jgi:hypothetical protein
MVLSLVASHAERLVAQTPEISRVRSTDIKITTLIARAVEQSATFRSLLEEIAATDGIVYVEPGRCGAVRACLTLKVTVAEPHRILWIRVDPRRNACDVMASIGHELWHAVEVLREPSIRSDGELYFFLARGREQNPTAWMETEAAIKVGQEVRSELREPCD